MSSGEKTAPEDGYDAVNPGSVFNRGSYSSRAVRLAQKPVSPVSPSLIIAPEEKEEV